MPASEMFSETKSKGFYVAEGPLTEESIRSMAKASQESTRKDRDRVKKRLASLPKG